MALDAEDVLSIQKLIAGYCHAVDAGDGAAFAALFSETASLDVGLPEPFVGREAIRELGSSVATMVPGVRHLTVNVLIDGDGDTATARSYVLVNATAGGPSETKMVSSGIYHDTFRKDGGTWRFVERSVANDG